MKILITGSAGFIGGHLLKALQKQGKHRFLGVDKKFGTDITNPQKLVPVVRKMLGIPDLIVHLAAQTSRRNSLSNPAQTAVDNIIGTACICDLARYWEARVIFASTQYALPNRNNQKQDWYGCSKKIGELMLENYGKNFGVEVIIDRIGNVYGPGQEGSQEAFWLAWFIKASLENLPIKIYGFGGRQSRDMLYIDDLVALLIDQIENFDKYKRLRPYEVGGGPRNEISLIEALEILNYKNYTFGRTLVGDSKRIVHDNYEISAVNGWEPKMPIEEGIQKTIEWCRERTRLDRYGKQLLDSLTGAKK